MSEFKLDTLPKGIMSSAQAYKAIAQIKELQEKKDVNELAKSRGILTPSQKTDAHIPPPLNSLISEVPKPEELEKLKELLEKVLQSAPVVRVTLSDVPAKGFQEQITQWFRDIHPFCMIELMVDDAIIGGVIVRTQHRQYDNSIRTLFSQKRVALGEIVAHA